MKAVHRFAIVGGVGALALVLLPPILPAYWVSLLTLVLIYAIFAMSLDLIMGYTGLPSLGHAAFWGSSAYMVGILTVRLGLESFWLSLAVSIIFAMIMAALSGLIALRLRGPYFLIVTLAISQMLWGVAIKWRSVTGGDDGLPGIARPDLGMAFLNLDNDITYYYFTLVAFVAGAALMYAVVRSPFGLILRGIRENEARIRAVGYNVWAYQYAAYILAAMFAGLSGLLSTYYAGFVGPGDLGVLRSVEAQLMVVLGGAGTLFGSILGAGILVVGGNVISLYSEHWNIILGAIYVLTVLLAPHGILGAIQRKVRAAKA